MDSMKSLTYIALKDSEMHCTVIIAIRFVTI